MEDHTDAPAEDGTEALAGTNAEALVEDLAKALVEDRADAPAEDGVNVATLDEAAEAFLTTHRFITDGFLEGVLGDLASDYNFEIDGQPCDRNRYKVHL